MSSIPVDIISGFLGAGKTTFIKHLFTHSYEDRKIAVIENDFGEVGIDGRILGETGSKVTEIVSGCICCTLVLDFQGAIGAAAADPDIDRIVIEPSGVAKLSDVIRACSSVESANVQLGMVNTVVDAVSYNKYADGFGAFFLDQVRNARRIFMSKVQQADPEDVKTIEERIRSENRTAEIFSFPWDSPDFFELLAGLTTGTDGAATTVNEPAHDHDGDSFESISIEISSGVSSESIRSALGQLTDEKELWEEGRIIRIKGILSTARGDFQIDWVHGSIDMRPTDLSGDGILVVIGREIPEEALRKLFASP